MTENKKLYLECLEKEISVLPKGYVSLKKINGKPQSYLQWQENGKKKSKYISSAIVDDVKAKIEKRRELEKELKKLKKELSKYIDFSIDYSSFVLNVKTGRELDAFLFGVDGYKKRECFIEIINYLKNPLSSKVLILYGLRRTGKTTLIKQAIAELNNKEQTAFIQVTQKDTLAGINADLRRLEEHGFKYVFIDEVTLLEDFISGAALFSDVFVSSGMKIVLSGTDSLGFLFAKDDQLFDRCVLLHTTFISYREFSNVLGIKGIDEYIRYGGTMSLSGENYNDDSPFANKEKTNEYVDSAIAKNIQHSLKFYQNEGHFRHLSDLYQSNELTSVINRVIEDMNHRFTLDVLTRDFKSNDLSVSANSLRRDKEKGTDILDRIDKDSLIARLKAMLEIKNKDEQSVEILDCHRVEIKEYLELLDLVVDVDIQSLPVGDKNDYRSVFTQPGMRFSIAKALIAGLLLDKEFQSLSAIDRNYVCDRILCEIKGRMIEDLVLLETKMALTKKDVFKLQFSVGEFDMVVVDNASLTCDVYEIKHSSRVVKEQHKNLIDKEKCDKTEFRFGKINHKYVIYRGESLLTEDGIEYLNIEDYLLGLKRVP